MLLKSQKRFALCTILAILSFALVIEGASLSQANAQSSPITYSGSFTFSTDLIIAESTDFLPLQQHRTCTISASFQELTLTYADYVGGLKGRVEVNADWSGDWSITPPSSTKTYNDGTSVTRTVTPSSGHVSGTLDVYLNAQLVDGKLAFTFTPYPAGHSSIFFLDELHGSVVTPQSDYFEDSPIEDVIKQLYDFDFSDQQTLPQTSTPSLASQDVAFSGNTPMTTLGSRASVTYSYQGTISVKLEGAQNPTPTSSPTPTPKVTPAQVPPGQAAIMSELVGTVQIIRAGQTQRIDATKDMVLHDGDRIVTGPHSKARFLIKGGAVGEVGENGEYIARSVEADPIATFDIIRGLFHDKDEFKKLFPQTEPKVRTPSGGGAVRGTEYTVYVAEDGSSTFTVIEGQVEVEENITKNTVTLGPGQSVTIYPYTTGTTIMTYTVDLSQLDRWWDEPFEQPSTFPLSLVITIAVVVAIVIGLAAIVIMRRKRSQRQSYLPPPPPPPSPPTIY